MKCTFVSISTHQPEPTPTLTNTPTHLDHEFRDLVRDLVNQHLNDPQDLRFGADQRRARQLLDLCLARLADDRVVSRHLLGHRDDERGGTGGRDERESVTGAATRVRRRAQRQAKRHAVRNGNWEI